MFLVVCQPLLTQDVWQDGGRVRFGFLFAEAE